MLQVPTTVNVSAVWNTTAGQNSLPAIPGNNTGNYWSGHWPKNVFDGNWTSVFASFGVGNFNALTPSGGLNTGVYLTIPAGSFVLKAFRFITTRNVWPRDPLKVTIEGSNLAGSALTLGSSWTLIYNGTTGLDINPGRSQPGVRQMLSDTTQAFSSYRFLIIERRGNAVCVDYAEIELYWI